jgi:nuclear factor I
MGDFFRVCVLVGGDETGLQHGSVVSLAASSNYGHEQGLVVATQHGGHGGTGGGNGGSGGPHSPGKYQENGHDTFSDFVTLVCQEAQNTQNAQVNLNFI